LAALAIAFWRFASVSSFHSSMPTNSLEVAYRDLADGTIVATTYADYRKEDVDCSIVSVRFKMSEVDAMAGGAVR
jgi:hypothetical protein